ncbi:uncharacterized protein K460DRAFT_341031 [Cucurbitaria berberidis CBS 394.84]|uniref:Ankyrin n=1 Tax=Cucurbitaria berberidis CBS 394.84 TaxID=1168544 RepID=A0A9P4GCM5_9PLEO|nr:uncharacterized protein K460DRAFT_341031 [Cucurbitaria berberidis CBS 394.84]KAF1843182.1 hypothetical protein K460DRAFT_341031 [Cucurbitaria berberidis CBS 394.84]
MELVELPPELLQRILELYVKNVGIIEAWGTRGTCRTFRSYIDYEVLSRPHLNTYLSSKAGRTILKKNMVGYVFHRSNNPTTFARDLVPKFIRAIMNELAIATGNESEGAAQSIRHTLCKVLVKYYKWTYFALTTIPSTALGISKLQHITIDNVPNRVAAAAAAGNLQAIRTFAEEDRSSIWGKSVAFGYPLVAATYAGHFHVVKAFVIQFITDLELDRLLAWQTERKPFSVAIRVAIQRQYSQILQYLVEKYVEAFGTASQRCMEKWLKAAVRTGRPEYVRLIVALRHHCSLLCIYDAFELSCKLNHPQVSRVFFEGNTLEVNEMLYHDFPIGTAFEYGSLSVIKELLDLGANPDGPRYIGDGNRPLCEALYEEETEICCLLLEKGANIDLVQPMINSKKDFIEKSPKLRELVKKADECRGPKLPLRVDGGLFASDDTA